VEGIGRQELRLVLDEVNDALIVRDLRASLRANAIEAGATGGLRVDPDKGAKLAMAIKAVEGRRLCERSSGRVLKAANLALRLQQMVGREVKARLHGIHHVSEGRSRQLIDDSR
jgi:hypothetical protein